MGFRRVFTRKEGGSRGKGVFNGQWNAIGYRRQAQLTSRKVSIFCFARGSSIQAVQTLSPPLVCSHFFLLSWRLPGAWVCWLPWDVGKIDVTDDESCCSLNHPFILSFIHLPRGPSKSLYFQHKVWKRQIAGGFGHMIAAPGACLARCQA